ncbi:MAG: hypothetical protein Q8O46_03420 [bacterium]|nr:hypothetical protein [bacterium]
MKKVILLHKKEGETPLEALEVFRSKHKAYSNVPLTYAGRLDPMVTGLLLIIAGDETKNKQKYLNLSKEYKFDILFGFATDTYDILGKVISSKVLTNIRMKKELEKRIQDNLRYFTGKFKQKYPLYSSKTIKQTRAGEKVKASEHMVEVTSLKFFGLKTISAKKLFKNIERRVAKVKGDFRQKEILKIWRENLSQLKDQFLIGSFYVKCGSGMYVRVLTNDLGKRIKISTLAYSIKRTKIGKWGKM